MHHLITHLYNNTVNKAVTCIIYVKMFDTHFAVSAVWVHAYLTWIMQVAIRVKAHEVLLTDTRVKIWFLISGTLGA